MKSVCMAPRVERHGCEQGLRTESRNELWTLSVFSSAKRDENTQHKGQTFHLLESVSFKCTVSG